jgi:hypothetical protein
MDKVIGSKQYRSVVVQDRPERRRLIITTVVLLFVLATWLSYWMGSQSWQGGCKALAADHELAVGQLASLELQYQELSQQLANISLGAEIDRHAVDNVRAVVGEHKQTITKLNEEISFYKGLMAPTAREQGLSIRSWEVYPTSDPSRFQFKLVMQQLAVKHKVLKGNVVVQLVGKQAEVEQTLPLNILSEQVDEAAIPLRFKYFQYIDGELQLPKGFVVERVDIIAKATAPKGDQVEKHYSWMVQNI